MADFSAEFPEIFKNWKNNSNSIICLGVPNECELLKLFDKFKNKTETVLFREPDIDNQATSICLMGYPEIRKKLRNLPLLGKPQFSLSDVHLKMLNTMQTDTQSVLEHGISVNKYFNNIIDLLSDGLTFDNIKIPDSILENKDYIINNLLESDVIQKYQLYHDIGKPYCITYEDGVKRFPDHAQKSYEIYRNVFYNDKDVNIVSKLILHDMDFHLLKPSMVDEYLKKTNLSDKEIITLLITTLAEINSNANLFGGIDSVNFKIKFKNYTKISKKVIEHLNKYEYEKSNN